MIAYLIKSAVCMLLLLGVYHLFLEREKMHRFNRYFLLFCLVFSLTVPLLTINIGAPAQLTDQISEINSRLNAEPPATTEYVPIPSTESQTTQPTSGSPLNYISFLIGLYGISASVLLVRLLHNLYLLVQKIRGNTHTSFGACSLILIDGCSMPHSFFSYIFVDKQLFESGQIREEILNHEQTHALQWHSLDILFIELLKVALWFNPVLWLYKRAVQLNHEFLADESVVADSNSVQSYQKMLLKMQTGHDDLQLASSIQFSITKKRIIMMTKNSTRLQTIGKQLAVIPVLAALVFAFSTYTASAQDVKKMSLAELMKAVNERIETADSLTAEEQEALNNFVIKMREEIKPDPPVPVNPPPPPMPKDADPQKVLDAMEEAYIEHVAYYNGIEPVEANLEELKKIYKRAMTFYDEIEELQPKVSDNPPPPPSKPLDPTEMIKHHSENSLPPPPQPPKELSEQNILRVLVNEEGLILMDEEPVPLDKVTAKVKAFITNNGDDPDLSESPQKAIIAIQTVRKTPHKTYTKIMENIQAAYLEVRNAKAQAEFGVDYEKLVENSPAQTKIQEMYPVRISIADPEQIEDENKTPPPSPPVKIADQNLLKIFVNREGLVLVNEAPIPLDKLAANVKTFITNNGDNPELSDSPKEAIISLKPSDDTPVGRLTDVQNEILKAHQQAKNEAAQAEFGMDFDQLEEGSAAKKRIGKKYRARISFVDHKPRPKPPVKTDTTSVEKISEEYNSMLKKYNAILATLENAEKLNVSYEQIVEFQDKWAKTFKENESVYGVFIPMNPTDRMLVYYRQHPKLAKKNKTILEMAVQNHEKVLRIYINIPPTDRNKQELGIRYAQIVTNYNNWNPIIKESSTGLALPPLPEAAWKRIKNHSN